MPARKIRLGKPVAVASQAKSAWRVTP